MKGTCATCGQFAGGHFAGCPEDDGPPDELFPAESVAMDSPRLAWMKRHGIVTHHSLPNDPHASRWYAGFWSWAEDFPQMDEVPQDPVGAEALFLFETGMNGPVNVGTGATEEDAITELCRKHGLKLWNEEREAPEIEPDPDAEEEDEE